MPFPIAAAIAGGISLTNAIIGAKQRKKENKKAQAMQLEGNKEMAMINHQNNLDMYEKTGYGSQVKQMTEAGLNPALMYGTAGGGGQTNGGQGQGVSAQQPYDISMRIAELANMTASAEKMKAETENIKATTEKQSGTDTEESQARINKTKQETIGLEFEQDIKNWVTSRGYADNIQWANEKTKTESQKANADWETYQATGYKDKSFSDLNSPIAKALTAGFEKSVEELKEAKLKNKGQEAENIIKNFEAKLSESGIAKNTPWYVKFVMDLIEKSGLNIFK